ncbi:hypothetical protein GCM10027562_19050 [Arthrobacter pigmenti]
MLPAGSITQNAPLWGILPAAPVVTCPKAEHYRVSDPNLHKRGPGEGSWSRRKSRGFRGKVPEKVPGFRGKVTGPRMRACTS